MGSSSIIQSPGRKRIMFMQNSVKDFIRRLRVAVFRIRMKNVSNLEISNRRVLVVAPHPDDEVLGCGGLIKRLCDNGNAPHVVILTRGEGSHRGCCGVSADELAKARHELTLKAAEVLGLPEENIHCLGYEDGGVPESEKGGKLEDIIGRLDPEVVMVPHWGEGWPDHVNAAKLVKSLVSANVDVYEYCVWMWYYNIWNLDWRNACRLKMTKNEHNVKKRAAQVYVGPQAPCGKPWSGVLPELFLEATTKDTELYFKV